MASSTLTNEKTTTVVVTGPVLQLVVIASCDDPKAPSSRHHLTNLDEVHFARGTERFTRTIMDGHHILRIELPDRRMSAEHCRLLRGPGGWVLDDPVSKNGTLVDGEPVRRALLAPGAVLELGRTFVVFDRSTTTPVDHRPDVVETQLDVPLRCLATFSDALAAKFGELAAAAPVQPICVTIRGETGTGKEVAARALHELSGRTGAFVAVNCGALPAGLIEAELFGHRRGAFTGAVNDRPGLVRAASGGTLFLDEIGELPLSSQAALLRVIQEQEVLPVGDDKPVKVDLRLCVATHRDLQELVDRGQFREDLLGRLIGVTLVMPPLRDRRIDFGLLLRALLARLPEADQLTFSPQAMRRLLTYHWRLNVRELEKVLVTVTALSGGKNVETKHLDDLLRAPPPAVEPLVEAPPRKALLSTHDEALRERLIGFLTVHKGNVVATALAMPALRPQIYRWAKRFGLDINSFRAKG